MSNYYYLVSSLPVLDFENDHTKLDFMALFEFIRSNIESSDRKYVESMLALNDIKNTIQVIAENRELPSPHPSFNPLSNIPEDIIKAYRNHPDRLPAFMQRVIEENEDKFADMSLEIIETLFLQEHFNILKYSEQPFLSEYAKFDLALRNITATLNGRKHPQSMYGKLITDHEIQHALSKSLAKDFGLSDQYPFIAQLANLIDQRSLTDIDLYVDRLRWEKSTELSSASIFKLDNILAYIIKLSIVKRRTEWSKDAGKTRVEFLTMQIVQKLEIPVG